MTFTITYLFWLLGVVLLVIGGMIVTDKEHPRRFTAGGRVGCCDDSPNQHASAHARDTGHPIIRSIQPGEDWSWCYVDELAMVIEDVRGSPRIPRSPLGG